MTKLLILNQQQLDSITFKGPTSNRPILLIGFQNQGNLGIGYLASMLMKHGYPVDILDFEEPPEKIIEFTKNRNPLLIGFSLIFQFYLPRFSQLMEALREQEIDCHFTMGGHFPSLSHEQTLQLAPELNSVVRFEGEQTLLELVECIAHSTEWRNLPGIAYRENEKIQSNELRALVHDLDDYPWPYMPIDSKNILGKKYMPLLASRGCARTCSFCSIHMFYRSAPGKIVRTRKPENVVEEMKMLHETRDISIFLFQDDDFPLFGPSWRRWTQNFVDELHRQHLADRVIWKISCRADAVERELFMAMRDAGLYLVYMGLESGSEDGLDTLHKQITVEQNLQAVSTLEELGIMWEYGFMLFDPSSTFESVKDNIRFLRKVVQFDEIAVTFGKMLPYDGTPIKEELIKTGRFKGDITRPDYDFLDPRMGEYFDELSQLTFSWVNGMEAPNHQLNTFWHELTILKHLYPPAEGLEEYTKFLHDNTHQYNDTMLATLEQIVETYELGVCTRSRYPLHFLDRHQFLSNLERGRNAFIYQNQEMMLKALAKEGALVTV